MNYKRPRYQQDNEFHAPTPECFCCNDTGIVTNGDGMVNDYYPDYDMQVVNGKTIRMAGSDAALICYCKVVYQQQDKQGQVIKEPLRNTDHTPVKHDTAAGERYVGACIDKHAYLEIHARRRDSWKETSKKMNAYRQDNAAGLNPATPEEIAKVKEQLADIGNLFGNLR